MKINRTNPILQYIREEEKKYKELFRVTEKFHSTMDINGVLAEIIHTLRQSFPQYDYVLLLSHDHEADADLPIKELEYRNENAAAISAYVNATVEMETEDGRPVMYAPLKGRQGVYGVLQVRSMDSTHITKSRMEFIRLLAYTAGSALENAKLYQQARKMNEDLRLINETSHHLNLASTLAETVDYLQELISKSFHSSSIGFILIDGAHIDVLEGSCDFFREEEGASLVASLLPKMKREREALFVGDTANREELCLSSFGTLMAVPMVAEDELKGMVVALGEESYSFTFEMFKLFQSLINRSTLAITNLLLREKLEKMVITDHLTKLYARSYLNSIIETSMKRDREGSFIMIDLDDFKMVNDTYGHQTGDDVLIQVAKLIKGNLRSTDIGARWGGEELAVYLPGVPLEYAIQVANRLRESVAENTEPGVTVSCGLSNWIFGQEDELKFLVHRADEALYEAKNAGKNQLVVNACEITI